MTIDPNELAVEFRDALRNAPPPAPAPKTGADLKDEFEREMQGVRNLMWLLDADVKELRDPAAEIKVGAIRLAPGDRVVSSTVSATRPNHTGVAFTIRYTGIFLVGDSREGTEAFTCIDSGSLAIELTKRLKNYFIEP